MKTRFRKVQTLMALVLALAILLSAVPLAVAESFSAFVKSGSMPVYSDASLTNQIGSLGQYTIVTVNAFSGNVAQIQAYGNTGYARVSDMEAVQAVSVRAELAYDTKVYAMPGDFAGVTALGKGTQVDVLAIQDKWALCKADNGIIGFVMLSTLKPVDAQPEATKTPQVYVETFTAEVSASSVTVYQQASESSGVMGTLSKGTQIKVTAYTTEWAQLEIAGMTGYARISGLTRELSTKEEESASSQNSIPGTVVTASCAVYQKNSTSSTRLGILPKGTQVNVLAIQGGWALIELYGNYGFCQVSNLVPTASLTTPEPTATLSTEDAEEATVTADAMKIYQSASTSSTQIGLLAKGIKVYVLAVQGDWAYITLSGNYGYCQVKDLSIGGAQPTPTPSTPENSIPGTVVTASCAVYQKNSTSSTRLGILPKGTQVNVLAIQGGWALIELYGNYGFCQVSNLVPTASLTTPEPTATPSTEGAEEATVTADAMKIYQSASTSSTQVGLLAKGIKVYVLAVQGDWAYITLSGNYGYCQVKDLSIGSAEPTVTPSTPENSIPGTVVTASCAVYQKNSTSSKRLGVLPKGTQVNVLAIQGGWALIELYGNYGFCQVSNLVPTASLTTPEPTATPSTEDAEEATVTADAMKIYQSASTSSTQVGLLVKGIKVYVLAVQGDWAYITLSGNYGYCQVKDLSIGSAEPTVTPAPTAPENSIPGTVVAASLVVYQKNSTSSSKLGTLPRGMQVNVVAVQGGWALIELNGAYGFCLVSGLVPTASLTTPEPTATPSTEDAIPAVVVTDTVKIYQSPSTSSTQVGQLSKGIQVNVLAVQGDWALIELSGNYGYCLVSSLMPVSAIPTPTNDPMGDFVQEVFSATVITSGAKFYASASTGSASVDIPLGTDVTVGAYNAQWAYVDVAGQKGFILISALSRAVYDTLSNGSSGSAVTNLESALLTLGYMDSNPSSTYSSYTEAAVKLFQSACGMSATGRADAATQRVLFSGNAPACSLLSGTYSKGSTGSNVSRIQMRLFALGYLSKTSSVDGDFGNNTYNAVKLFQTGNGLSVTGTADSATLRKMYSIGAVHLPDGVNPGDVGIIVDPQPGDQQNNSTTISSTLASKTSSYSPSMSNAEKLEYVIYVGQNQLGKPYVYGATGTSSYDCSGFTVYCFRQIGVQLQRTAMNQGYDDDYTKISSISSLKRGDLVFFNTVSDNDKCDHTGIYLGAGYFIHASSGQRKVVVSTLASGYYNGVFSWGRRVLN